MKINKWVCLFIAVFFLVKAFWGVLWRCEIFIPLLDMLNVFLWGRTFIFKLEEERVYKDLLEYDRRLDEFKTEFEKEKEKLRKTREEDGN